MSEIRVESFDVDVANAGTHALANDVGALSSAFIKINNCSRKGSAGRIGSTSNAAPSEATMRAYLSATNQITFLGDTTTNKLMGEVWRYTGAVGGANEFITRGQVELTIPNGQTEARVAVSGVVNPHKVVPFLQGAHSTANSVNDWDAATIGVWFDPATNEVVISRQATNGVITAYVSAVEFTGANWRIGHGRSGAHDAAAETVTLNTQADQLGATFSVTAGWANAFIEATGQGDTSETGLSDTFFTAYPAGNDTDVVVDYQGEGDNSARNDGIAYVYVLDNPQITVTRQRLDNINEGNNSYGTNLGFPAGTNTTRNLDELALEWYVDTTGTGTAHARGALAARITDPTGTVRHWVHRSGNNVDVRYGVIDLSQVVDNAPPRDILPAAYALDVEFVEHEARRFDGVTETWQAVTFVKAYTTPRVVATIEYDLGVLEDSIKAEVRNVTATGCEIRMRVPHNEVGNTTPASASVHLLVVEDTGGVVKKLLGSNVEVQTGSLSTTTNSSNSTFTSDVGNIVALDPAINTNPVILAQRTTHNDAKFAYAWVSKNTDNSLPPEAADSHFTLGLCDGELASGNFAVAEQVDYIVFKTQSSVTVDNGNLSSARYIDVQGIDDQPAGYSTGINVGGVPEVVLMQQQNMNGTDGSWALLMSRTATDITSVALEVQNIDTERAHAVEVMAYIAFETATPAASETQETTTLPAAYAIQLTAQTTLPAAYTVAEQQVTSIPADYAIAGSATCLAGWGQRKPITIVGSVDGAQTDYQIKVRVHKSTGTDTATDIYLGNDVRDDFGDVRFTSDDGTTLLDYWREELVSGVSALFWVKVPSIPADPATVDIYLQYDNAAATTTADIKATFVKALDGNETAVSLYNQDTPAHTLTQTDSPTLGGVFQLGFNADQGNRWVGYDVGNFDLASDHILGVYFNGGNEGEIIAVGVDNQVGSLPSSNDERIQQFWGTQSYGNNSDQQYGGAGTEYLETRPLLTGTYNYLTLIHDNDDGLNVNSIFYGVRLRKWTTNEPAISSVGAAETCGAGGGTTQELTTLPTAYAVTVEQATTVATEYAVVDQAVETVPTDYAIADQAVTTVPSGYAVAAPQSDTVAADYAISDVESITVPTEYAVLDSVLTTLVADYRFAGGAIDNVPADYAVVTQTVTVLGSGYAIADVEQDTTPADYAVAVPQVEQVPTDYAVAVGALDTVPTEYSVSVEQVETVGADYRVASQTITVLTADYRFAVEGSELETVPATYGVLTSAVDTLVSGYAIATPEGETVSAEYAVQSQASEQVPAEYGIVTDALDTVVTSYAVAAQEQNTVTGDYVILVQSGIQAPAEYAILTNSLLSLPTEFKVNQNVTDATPALYTVITSPVITLDAEYFVQLPITKVLTVLGSGYSLWDIDTGCRLPIQPTPSPYTKAVDPYDPAAGGVQAAPSPYTPTAPNISKTCL